MIIDSAEKYAWFNWIHHFLDVRSWNDKVIQEFKKLPPSVFAAWLSPDMTNSVKDLRGAIDRFNTLKSWFIGQVFWHNQNVLPRVLTHTVIGCNRQIRSHHYEYPMRERPGHVFQECAEK